MKEILIATLILALGFVMLIKGADYFVDACSSIAKQFNIPSMIIGLTIVAMGTSLPECAVSITASLDGSNELAISNAVGSNIFNLMVVCGCCALFTPLAVQASTLKKEFPFSIICAILLFGLGILGKPESLDIHQEGGIFSPGLLGRIDGIIMIVIFVIYLVSMVISAKKNPAQADEEYQLLPWWKCLIFIVGGAAAIKFGGDFVVKGATTIARSFHLSENLIGLTIVALGTSLPELVTSLVAARKNEVDMALGNVVGSNIFNILLVLGLAGSISPVTMISDNFIDILILILMSVIVWIFAWHQKKITRGEGICMLTLYVGYMVYICAR